VSAKFLEQRASLLNLHHQLFDAGLVVWSGGNISQRVEGGFFNKRSGLMYTQLTTESMV
jgi:ribulose-5-phosphate 4-epimerase/fuculose-1-phosphate aldolase